VSTSAPAAASPSAGQRWLARGALAAAAASVVALIAGAGTHSIALLFLVLGHFVVAAMGLWLAVAHRGLMRIAGLVLVIGAQISVLVIEATHNLLWVVVACVALLVLAVVTARAALRPDAVPSAPVEHSIPAPRQPFMIMNPRSGGGKVERFHLREKAESLGAEVAMVDGPGVVDVAELARNAVDNGADLLGVAGGDGTQALVAGVAAEHDIPLLVIPAGTRNHFALDLGLDRDDPSLALDALRDGVELHIDLGDVSGRPFVNNVSFGAYATIVARQDYRDDKVHVTLDVLPDLLSGHQGAKLTVRAHGTTVPDPQAALVSNNPYGMGDVAGLGRRARLDGGELGLVAVRVGSAAQAAQLLRGRHAPGLTLITSPDVVVESDGGGDVAAGIDGESVMLPSPVTCRVRPRSLRVRVPRDRPGVPPTQQAITFGRLIHLAGPGWRSHHRATS
jgi:diacylglycerol kinase family enzyme